MLLTRGSAGGESVKVARSAGGNFPFSVCMWPRLCSKVPEANIYILKKIWSEAVNVFRKLRRRRRRRRCWMVDRGCVFAGGGGGGGGGGGVWLCNYVGERKKKGGKSWVWFAGIAQDRRCTGRFHIKFGESRGEHHTLGALWSSPRCFYERDLRAPWRAQSPM